MRVVETANFGGDYPDERFHSDSVSLEQATELADFLNSKAGGDYATRYFKVVEDDYKLQPGFEP